MELLYQRLRDLEEQTILLEQQQHEIQEQHQRACNKLKIYLKLQKSTLNFYRANEVWCVATKGTTMADKSVQVYDTEFALNLLQHILGAAMSGNEITAHENFINDAINVLLSVDCARESLFERSLIAAN